MGKLKDFFGSPKKMAILGLIGSLLMLSSWSIYFNILDKFYVIGLIIYFVIILVRMYIQKGNLKIANYTIIVSYIIQLLTVILNILFAIRPVYQIYAIVYVALLIILPLYFSNILLGKKNFINNKIFAITIILYTVLQEISVIKAYNLMTVKYSSFVETTIYVINYLGYLFIIPYFYNYYNLLKGENKNAK